MRLAYRAAPMPPTRVFDPHGGNEAPEAKGTLPLVSAIPMRGTEKAARRAIFDPHEG